MGVVKDANWDLFVSYAHNDDVPEARPWVTGFVGKLRELIPRRLGSKDVTIFFDSSDVRGPGELDPKIAEGVKGSAFFVALLSRSYVQSDWCIKELQLFLDGSPRAIDRLFLVDLDNVLTDNEFKPVLERHLSANSLASSTIRRIRAAVRHRFWNLNEINNKVQVLADDPASPTLNAKFSEEIFALADDISSAVLRRAYGPTLITVPARRGGGMSKAPFPAQAGATYRGRMRSVDDSARAYVATSGAATGLLELLEGLDSSELASPADETVFLAALENFIRAELTKSRDEHFIELSMKLASATEGNVAPLYSSPRLALVSYGQEQKLSEVPDLQALQRSLIDYGKLVMLAPPGSGKTTLLHHLTLKYIGDYRSGGSNFLPIFVPLALYIRERGTSIYPAAAEWIKRFVATIVSEDNFVHREFDKLARAGRLIFILDGLDQLPDRRSQLARLEDLKRMESRVQRLALLAKAARFAGGQDAVSVLEEQQQAAFERAGPEIDRRERSIEVLANETPSPIIVSCRVNDFIGVPRWQRIDVMPMSKEQVDQFVELYAREAKEIIDQQWNADSATRSLVSNPFYLRMLTRAVEEGRVRESKHLRQILSRRGWLLSHLIWTGVLREVSDHRLKPTSDDERIAVSCMNDLGDLAFFMMSRNFIRGLTMEIVTEQIGQHAAQIMKVARDAGIVDISDAETPDRMAIDFNHQLFLEVLLADYLRRRLKEVGQFQELLALLGNRGDRWAETLKLLSELLPPDQHEILVDHCIQALGNTETSDIAMRVLAEIGQLAAPKVIDLTRKGNEIARRGAAQVLGQLGAQSVGDALIRMKADTEWSVRRAAVDALYRLNLKDALIGFRNDPSPAVRRAVYKAEIALSEDPLATVFSGLRNQDAETAHFARAAREMFDFLLTRGSPDQIAGLLDTMCRSKNEVVHITGYMLAGAAPEEVRILLKKQLLTASIVEANESVASLALQALRGTLSHNDLDEIIRISDGIEFLNLNFLQQMRARVRARTLRFEVQSQESLDAYAQSLESVPLAEVQTVTNQLASRNDPAALAALTYLLRHRATARAAGSAMSSMGPQGVALLLSCLDDDVEEIRTRTARLLRYCDLPRRYAVLVRRNLKDEGIFVLQSPDDMQFRMNSAIQLVFPLTAFVVSLFYACVSWLFGSGAWYTYWVQYHLIERNPKRMLGLPEDMDAIVIRNVEDLVFGLPKMDQRVDYWLARARIMNRSGEADAAIRSLEQALVVDPQSVEAAYELGLSWRRRGETDRALELAMNIVEAEPERAAKMRSLAEVLKLDAKSRHSDDLSAHEQWAAIEALWQLDEYAEVLQRLKLFRYADLPLPNGFYLRLCDAYAGTSDPRGALGAALINNARSDAESKVSTARVEMWRSQVVRSEIDKEVIARFAVWTDLACYQEACEELFSAGILPADKADFGPSHILKLGMVPPDLRPGIKACLEALDAGSEYIDRVSEILKLNY